MKSRIALLFLLSSLVLVRPHNALSQGVVSSVPKEPIALLNLAQEKNGLTGQGIQPWHIHGAYRSYDKQGKVEYEGIYEEWWASATRYKRSFSDPNFTQTDYATGSKLLRTGAQEWPRGLEWLLRESAIDPLPKAHLLNQYELKPWPASTAPAGFACISMLYPVRPNLSVKGDFFPFACTDAGRPMLRMYAPGSGVKIFYNNLVEFQGHYLARQVQIYISEKLAAELDLDVIEPMKADGESILNPPAGAVAVDLSNITFDKAEGSHWPRPLRKDLPVYPDAAKSMRIQGTVNIEAAVAEDGHIVDMKVLGGPPALRPASLDAVKNWEYRPLEVMGQPRPFRVAVQVIFALGGSYNRF